MNHLVVVNWASLLWPFLVSLMVSTLLTPLALVIAKRRRLFDQPDPRRVHKSPIPRLGGIAIFWAILVATWIFFPGDSRLLGFELGLIIIFLVGILDDLYSLPPVTKLAGQLLAASTAILFGITVAHLTNPFGGPPLALSPIVDIIVTLIWILLVVNTLNLLDGLDGLAAGVSGITSLALMVLSLTLIVNQPDTATLAAIVAGGALGFLFHNWHPAKIFMGDSGSHVLGFAIAMLAIISGGKIATAALVLAIPIIDVVWAGLRRIAQKKSPFKADRGHLHHLMLDLGMTQPQAVGLMYLLTIIVGASALFSGTTVKLFLMIVVCLIVGIILALVAHFRRRQQIRN